MDKSSVVQPPSVTFWGATRTVTGSMHQVRAGGKTILLDCGLFQGRRDESFHRNREFPFRAKDIDAVVLSHAHIDHCGNLPNLVRRGFAGPIFCTPATRALAAVMLGDAAKIQEEDAVYLNRKRAKDEPKVQPIYDGRDVFRTLHRLQAVKYGAKIPLGKGIEATFAGLWRDRRSRCDSCTASRIVPRSWRRDCAASVSRTSPFPIEAKVQRFVPTTVFAP